MALEALGQDSPDTLVNLDMFQVPQAQEAAIAEKVDEITGKVKPVGAPLEPFTDGVVPITPEDVAIAMRAWDQRMPPEAAGLLSARTATDEEQAAAEREL